MAKEKLPIFNIPRMEKLRDALFHEAFLPRFQETLTADDLWWVVGKVQEKISGVPPDTLFEALRYLTAQPLTPAIALQASWRLAGNVDRLRWGQAVSAWLSQAEDEWVPVQIMRCVETRNNRNVYGFMFSCRVLMGTASGMLLHHFWRTGVVRLLARRLGFSRSFGKFPFRSASQLVLLRTCVLIEKARSLRVPEFFKIECPPSMVVWNRQGPLAYRCRRVQCPNGWSHSCHGCIVGYDTCLGGTHATAYVKRFCQQCGTEGQFNPEENTGYCIRCNRVDRLRRIT